MSAHLVKRYVPGVLLLFVATGLGPAAPASAQRSFFVGPDGVPLLTNRPEAYRNRYDYAEVRIDFEPIVISGRYESARGAGGLETADVGELVRHYAALYGVDEPLVLAVIRAESNFDPYALSKAGARGLMQLMPGTAAEMMVSDPYDPEQNVAAGTQYLSKLLGLYDQDVEIALAAYNAGPGTVKKYGGVPPYRETREYVRKVKRYAREYKRERVAVRLQPGTRPRAADELPGHGAPFVVHFRNGTTQPAQIVEDMGRYYVVEFAGRRYTVGKSLVTDVVQIG